eukprot:1123560-Rhodomonas_salina.1
MLMLLRHSYAMSGTGLACAATRHVSAAATGLRACYALSSTEIAYAATRCPVLRSRMLLRDVRY